MDYKAHLFQSLGNGKYHPSRTECGRSLQRNARGTFVTNKKHFIELLKESPTNVCSKCLEKLKK